MDYLGIAIKNLSKNIGKYTTFFIACISSLALNFIHSTLVYNDITLISKNNLLIIILKLSMVIIIGMLCYFLIYAYISYMKLREKEFKLLMLIGMTQKELFGVLLVENTILLSICLIFGILLGAVFSKIFFMSLLKYLGLNSINLRLIKINYISIISFGIVLYVILGRMAKKVLIDITTLEKYQGERFILKVKRGAKVLALIALIILNVWLWIHSASNKNYVPTSKWVNCVTFLYLLIFYVSKLILSFFNKKKYFYNGKFLSFQATIKNLYKGDTFLFRITFFSFLFITYNSIYKIYIHDTARITVNEIKILNLIDSFTNITFFFILASILYFKSQIELEYMKDYFSRLYLVGLTKNELRATAKRLLTSIFFTSCTLNCFMTVFYLLWVKIDFGYFKSNLILLLLAYIFNFIAYSKARDKYNLIIDLL
ncbi:ABC transporter permease [Clostridium zeae]|uniref:ABC transporter permease n=1 Tax=Clostridium zeae TaxID=2759022 RepID=A0ABQ1E9A5_9CLOT|nr:FtsX-like permease family protein [Clostridium zeae]GFZ31318.1 ABC transporter permease [Clostridium zeae]